MRTEFEFVKESLRGLIILLFEEDSHSGECLVGKTGLRSLSRGVNADCKEKQSTGQKQSQAPHPASLGCVTLYRLDTGHQKTAISSCPGPFPAYGNVVSVEVDRGTKRCLGRNHLEQHLQAELDFTRRSTARGNVP